MEENGNYEVEVLKVDSMQTLNIMGSAYGLESENNSGLTPIGSMEDLSEYQDADESISSAPTEFLAEFLSSVMLKDYENALKYCKLILQYEPENAAAKEFYPLIVEKLKLMSEEENETSNSSSDDSSSTDSDDVDRNTSETDSEATTASYSSLEDEEAEPTAATNFSDSNGNQTNGHSNNLENPLPFLCTSSDSESPTEPVSTQAINHLRGKVIPKGKCN